MAACGQLGEPGDYQLPLRAHTEDIILQFLEVMPSQRIARNFAICCQRYGPSESWFVPKDTF
jgi:hypothetical protein